MEAGYPTRLGIVLCGLAIAVGAVGLFISAPWKTADNEPCNVVILSLGATGSEHLPFYGYERDTAPTMAELARRGVVFDNASPSQAHTVAAHASILTGLAPATHGIEGEGDRLTRGVATLAAMLDQRGYVTGAFVSSAQLADSTGLSAGFDSYDNDLAGASRRSAEQALRPALPWVRQRAEAGERFFLFFHVDDPRYPCEPPPPYDTRFAGTDQVGRYDGAIAYADHQLGLLVEHLQELGVADETMFVFVSDHGQSQDGQPEQTPVPLVMRLPGDRHAGHRIATEVSHLDIVPTILDVLGAAPGDQFPGRSLLPEIDSGARE